MPLNVLEVFTDAVSDGFAIASAKSGVALTVSDNICVFVVAPATAALIVTTKLPAGVPVDAAIVNVIATGVVLVGDTVADG